MIKKYPFYRKNLLKKIVESDDDISQTFKYKSKGCSTLLLGKMSAHI